MGPNVLTEAGLSITLRQWWEGIPFLTSAVIAVCGAIYLICLLTGYDSFYEICFLPSAIISRFQVIVTITILTQFCNLSSAFGLLNVPAYMYVWILWLVFQVLMSIVSFLGHLCRILSGFAYTYGLFNFLIPGPSLFSAIEVSPLLTSCVRRPKFIMCTASSTTGYIPTTYTNQITSPCTLFAGNLWRNLTSRMPQGQTSLQANNSQDGRFPGRGRTLGSIRTDNIVNSDSNLQARLLDNSNIERTAGHHLQDRRTPSLFCHAVYVKLNFSAVPVSAESPPPDLFFRRFVGFISKKFQSNGIR